MSLNRDKNVIFTRGEKQPGPHKTVFKLIAESGEGFTDFSATPRTPRPKVQNRSVTEMGRSQLPSEMSEELNVNRLKNVSTQFCIIRVFPPAATDPSVVDV